MYFLPEYVYNRFTDADVTLEPGKAEPAHSSTAKHGRMWITDYIFEVINQSFHRNFCYKPIILQITTHVMQQKKRKKKLIIKGK